MMLHRKKIARRLLIVSAVLVGSLFELRPANAIIGRPLTPLSYAGVARRTTRRAVVYGGAYGAAAAPMYAPPPAYYAPPPGYW